MNFQVSKYKTQVERAAKGLADGTCKAVKAAIFQLGGVEDVGLLETVVVDEFVGGGAPTPFLVVVPIRGVLREALTPGIVCSLVTSPSTSVGSRVLCTRDVSVACLTR